MSESERSHAPGGAEPDRFDVVVYGGTSAGVVAAVQAAASGRRTVLIEPGRHLGGLTSGGLGATDMGDDQGIGGLALDFYRRVKDHYSKPDAWTYGSLETYRSHRYDPDAPAMFHFEPHVAERLFDEMMAASGATLILGERLDRTRGVVKDGRHIRAVVMESGRTVHGSMFIDATYEGDLMAGAGVTYAVGRESTQTYGEPHNGNQWKHMRDRSAPVGHDFFRAVDPYVIPGASSSGTIFGVPPEGPGVVGEGDARVQAYCYRLCLTDVEDNLAPIQRPDGYRASDYELLLRYLTSETMLPEWPAAKAVEHPVLGHNLSNEPPMVIMPNGKSDSNTKGAVSFNLVGGNYEYPDGDYATRERIIADHRRWQQGLMYFTANDPRVPARYREASARWGLAKDEFVDNDNWPHQLYIREARRMVGEFVMTEQVCLSERAAPDSVGLASYTIDSHNVRRYIDEHGHVRNEGTLGIFAPQAYGVGYGSLVPREDECTNLLVPVCLSASHAAYGSIRMEPVFMVLGQSAATAAVQALDEDRPVQQIDRARLRETLLAAGQVLDVPPGSANRPYWE